MGLPDGLTAGPKGWTSPEGLSSTLQVMLLLAVLSLAPAALLMTTCFVRIVVVLSLLRQAIGTQNLPPTQVITTLALFLTLLIMTPVWKQVYDEAVVPYTQHQIGAEQAWNAGVAPVRKFMSMQIENTQNTEDVWLFMSYLPHRATPASYDDVPLQALLPAFMLSELKTAFLIGFQIYLPFSDPRHGGGQRDGVDGHVDGAAGVGFAPLQAPVVRAGRRLAFGGGNVVAEFSTVYVRRLGIEGLGIRDCRIVSPELLRFRSLIPHPSSLIPSHGPSRSH